MRNREELVLLVLFHCPVCALMEMRQRNNSWMCAELRSSESLQVWEQSQFGRHKQKERVREEDEGLDGSPGQDCKRAGTSEKLEAVSLRYFLHPISPIEIHAVLWNYRVGLD